MDFSEVVALFIRRRWLVATVIGLTLFANAVILRVQPTRYGVDAMLQVNSQASATFTSNALEGVPIFDSFSMPVFLELTSGGKLTAAVEKRLTEEGLEQFSGKFRRNRLTLKPKAGSDSKGTFLAVNYIDEDPETAEVLADVAIRSIQAVCQEFFESSVRAGRERFEQTVAELQGEITKIDDELLVLREKAQLPEGSDNLTELVSSLHETIGKLELSEVELAGQIKGLEAKIEAATPKEGVEAFEDPLQLLSQVADHPIRAEIRDSASRLIHAELELSKLGRTYKPDHPEYERAAKTLEAAQIHYSSFLEEGTRAYARVQQALRFRVGRASDEVRVASAELLGLRTRQEAARNLANEKREVLDRIRTYESPILQLERDRETKQQGMTQVQQTLGALVGATNLAPEVVKVFEEASAPRSIGKLLENYFLVIFLLGVVLSIAAVYAVEVFDHRIYNQHGLRKHTHLPCLGILPKVGKESLDLFVRDNGPMAEAFNSIIKKALVALGDGKVLLVSGPDPAAGKTFVSSQMAFAAARLGIPTLLVDCDLRQPRVHGAIQRPRAPGLSELLGGEYPAENQALHEQFAKVERGEARLRLPVSELGRTASGPVCVLDLPDTWPSVARPIEGLPLCVVTAGAAAGDPAALLNSPPMLRFLEEAREHYALIVLDTPPINVVSDALLMAQHVDANLLVVRAGRTKAQDLHWARQSLEEIGAPVAGLVLNGLSHRVPGYYSYYYGKRYYRARF